MVLYGTTIVPTAAGTVVASPFHPFATTIAAPTYSAAPIPAPFATTIATGATFLNQPGAATYVPYSPYSPYTPYTPYAPFAPAYSTYPYTYGAYAAPFAPAPFAPFGYGGYFF